MTCPTVSPSPLLGWIDQLPGMDAGVARRVRGRLDGLRTVVSDRELISGVVVHGDAHLANVLWHDGRLAALLDRLGRLFILADRPRVRFA